MLSSIVAEMVGRSSVRWMYATRPRPTDYKSGCGMFTAFQYYPCCSSAHLERARWSTTVRLLLLGKHPMNGRSSTGAGQLVGAAWPESSGRLRLAGLSELIRFHDLRHASATTIVRAGIHARTVSARPGHSQSALRWICTPMRCATPTRMRPRRWGR
jgi:hypothetical protein